MKIEIHLLQNFPPSCLNRDDTNTPKDCEFGGVRRARVSSQCLKRSMREYFRAHNTEVGERTKRLRAAVLGRLGDLEAQARSEHEVGDALEAFIEGYYAKMDSKHAGQTSVLLFLSPREIDEVAACVRDLWNAGTLRADAAERRKAVEGADKKGKKPKKGAAAEAADEGDSGAGTEVKNLPKSKVDKAIMERLLHAALSPDVALFGRMLAEQPTLRVDAAAQVAHAISTHKVNPEMDFYSAVDDLSHGEPGAGMLGVTGYNAPCFYRYALIDRPQLIKNLGGEASADRAIEAFLEAAVHAIPTGKQNSMAAQNPPSFGLFVVRASRAPASLANAFASPVYAGEDGEDLVGESIGRLTKYFERLARVYGADGIAGRAGFCIEGDENLNGLAEHCQHSLQGAIDATMSAVRAGLPKPDAAGEPAPTAAGAAS